MEVNGGVTRATSVMLCGLEPTWSRFKRKCEGTAGVDDGFKVLRYKGKQRRETIAREGWEVKRGFFNMLFKFFI